MKHPGKIGSSWTGLKYIHGPRMHPPSRYSEFRIGKETESGIKPVFGKIKGSSKWELQSFLRPKK